MAPKSRADLINDLAAASLAGTLGLFVGAGYSKALTLGRSPSWGQLLQSVALDLGLSDPLRDPASVLGSSFPKIATQMVTEIEPTLPAFFRGDSVLRRNEAIRRLKLEVSRKTALVADPAALAMAQTLLRALQPAWVVTTNYDFLVENSLDHPETLLPDQTIRARRGMVPVVHIHGHVVNPSSIVIAEEDYAQALNPTDYRHVRLGLLFAESTTLMIGYSLGDVNVQTALQYSRRYRNPSEEMHPADLGDLVFAHRTPAPEAEPRLGAWGEVIVDATESFALLAEIVAARAPLADYWERVKTFAAGLASQPGATNFFVNDPAWRKSFIEGVRLVPAALGAGGTVQFVQQALSELSRRATSSGGWPHYTTWLNVVLDVMEQWPLGTMPPQLFEYIAKELQDISSLIEPNGNTSILGYAWAATTLWHNRKATVFGTRRELLRALRTFAERERATKLLGILPPLP